MMLKSKSTADILTQTDSSYRQYGILCTSITEPPHITSVQYCGGCSVHWRLFSTSGDNISTVGDSFSTVEVVQYSGGITSVHAGG